MLLLTFIVSKISAKPTRDEDVGGAHGLRGDEAEQPQGTGAADQHRRPHGHPGAAARVDGDGEGLDEGALLQAHGVWQPGGHREVNVWQSGVDVQQLHRMPLHIK